MMFISKINKMLHRIFLVFLIIFYGFLFAHEIHAVPAPPFINEIRQPSGEVIKVRIRGDEWNNWIEVIDGYTIEKSNNGYWYYVEYFDEQIPVLSHVYAHEAPPKELKKHIYPRSKALKHIKIHKRKRISDTIRARAYGQFTGEILFILAEFSDRHGEYSESDFALSINKISDYYNKASYGKVKLSPAKETFGTVDNGVVGWINLGYDHPDTKGMVLFSNQKITKDAIIAADPNVNFKEYDTNDDGYVDADELAVVVVVAGYDFTTVSPDASPSIHPHMGHLDIIEAPTLDGVIVGDYHNDAGGYAQVAEIQSIAMYVEYQSTLGVMAHELGHLIFRLPDLYDFDYDSFGVGIFCIMGSGSYGQASHVFEYPGEKPVLPCAWCKFILGWVDASVESGNVSIQASGSPSATSSNTVYRLITPNPNEYFLIENRQPLGYDRGLEELVGKDFGGLAIWHIDENRIDNYLECFPPYGCTYAHYKVSLEQADGGWDLEENLNHGEGSDLWYTDNASVFNDTSIPNSNLYNGDPSLVSVTNISDPNETMTATLSCVREILVQHDYSTIQEAINGAMDGDVIIVPKGIHKENINYLGKAITIVSEDPFDPNVSGATIIDGGQSGSVVTFNNGEGGDSVLIGVTLRNGNSLNGGGIFCSSSSPSIISCNVYENKAMSYGGGIYCASSSPNIFNCIFSRNSGDYGGGIYCSFSSPSIINCTFSGNLANNGGGLACIQSSSPIVKNCILWEDSPDEIYTDDNSIPTLTYSNIQNEDFGGENINDNPLFVDSNAGDYHLKPDSPCIDSGSNTDAPHFDRDYIHRPQDGDRKGAAICDIGAYEYSPPEWRIVSPGESIQDAILAGCLQIFLQPGDYYERIDFTGKAITVTSINPADPNVIAATVIDGGQSGSVVTFNNGEGNDSILTGVTLRNGSSLYGGGIYCNASSPRIMNTDFHGN